MASSRKIMAKTHDDGVLDGVLDVLIAHPILLRVPLETGRHGEASPVNFSGNNRLSRMFSPCCPPRSRMALLQSSSPFRTSRPGCDLSATVTVASRGLARWQQWSSDLQSIMRRSKNARNPLIFSFSHSQARTPPKACRVFSDPGRRIPRDSRFGTTDQESPTACFAGSKRQAAVPEADSATHVCSRLLWPCPQVAAPACATAVILQQLLHAESHTLA